jgi:integrase/recombinase XerD
LLGCVETANLCRVRLLCCPGHYRHADTLTEGLDDRGHVGLLRLYLARTGYTAGPLFRASINGRGGPLSYDAAHHRWQTYCAAAGLDLDIHQLRHAHATELITGRVASDASSKGIQRIA